MESTKSSQIEQSSSTVRSKTKVLPPSGTIAVAVVGMPNEPVHEFESVDALIQRASSLGWTVGGYTGGNHLNKKLLGLPYFKELAGPMLDGMPVTGLPFIRYETLRANNFYSR